MKRLINKRYIEKRVGREQNRKLEKVGKMSTDSMPFWHKVKDKGKEEKERRWNVSMTFNWARLSSSHQSTALPLMSTMFPRKAYLIIFDTIGHCLPENREMGLPISWFQEIIHDSPFSWKSGVIIFMALTYWIAKHKINSRIRTRII